MTTRLRDLNWPVITVIAISLAFWAWVIVGVVS